MALDIEDLDASDAIAAQEEPAPGTEVPRARTPWISQRDRFEIGRTPGCSDCEALLITGGPASHHSSECWDGVMKLLAETEHGQTKVARAEARME